MNLSKNKMTVLFVDDEPNVLKALRRATKKMDANILTAESGREALKIMEEGLVDIVVSDLNMPEMDGHELLEKVAASSPETVRIMLTANVDADSVIKAINRGRIWGYVQKPWDNSHLIITIEQAIFMQEVMAERSLLRRTLDQYQHSFRNSFEGFIGNSIPMQFVYSSIAQSAPSQASVFITGPSGTGKEVAAAAIHNLSSRKDKPFVAINCAAIPTELMESEIFGHIKGAFSGAFANRDGAASLANGGTLFLDEIGEMDINLQAKLLRFIQTSQFKKIGGNTVEEVDIRFVCATNIEPLQGIKDKKLREDLYYRLNVISIDLPVLNERETDPAMIANYFLEKYSKLENKIFVSLSSNADNLINNYEWPGNVRQLQNIIHSSVIMSEGPLLTENVIGKQLGLSETEIQSLSKEYGMPKRPVFTSNSEPVLTGSQSNIIIPLADVERQVIEQAVQISEDNVVKAAGALGVSPSTLYRKMQQWQTP